MSQEERPRRTVSEVDLRRWGLWILAVGGFLVLFLQFYVIMFFSSNVSSINRWSFVPFLLTPTVLILGLIWGIIKLCNPPD